MAKGRVKWFNATKGFGFIVQDGGGDLFVHYSDVEVGKGLRDGYQVEFSVGQGRKGPAAKNVKLVNQAKSRQTKQAKREFGWIVSLASWGGKIYDSQGYQHEYRRETLPPELAKLDSGLFEGDQRPHVSFRTGKGGYAVDLRVEQPPAQVNVEKGPEPVHVELEPDPEPEEEKLGSWKTGTVVALEPKDQYRKVALAVIEHESGRKYVFPQNGYYFHKMSPLEVGLKVTFFEPYTYPTWTRAEVKGYSVKPVDLENLKTSYIAKCRERAWQPIDEPTLIKFGWSISKTNQRFELDESGQFEWEIWDYVFIPASSEDEAWIPHLPWPFEKDEIRQTVRQPVFPGDPRKLWSEFDDMGDMEWHDFDDDTEYPPKEREQLIAEYEDTTAAARSAWKANPKRVLIDAVGYVRRNDLDTIEQLCKATGGAELFENVLRLAGQAALQAEDQDRKAELPSFFSHDPNTCDYCGQRFSKPYPSEEPLQLQTKHKDSMGLSQRGKHHDALCYRCMYPDLDFVPEVLGQQWWGKCKQQFRRRKSHFTQGYHSEKYQKLFDPRNWVKIVKGGKQWKL